MKNVILNFVIKNRVFSSVQIYKKYRFKLINKCINLLFNKDKSFGYLVALKKNPGYPGFFLIK